MPGPVLRARAAALRCSAAPLAERRSRRRREPGACGPRPDELRRRRASAAGEHGAPAGPAVGGGRCRRRARATVKGATARLVGARGAGACRRRRRGGRARAPADCDPAASVGGGEGRRARSAGPPSSRMDDVDAASSAAGATAGSPLKATRTDSPLRSTPRQRRKRVGARRGSRRRAQRPRISISRGRRSRRISGERRGKRRTAARGQTRCGADAPCWSGRAAPAVGAREGRGAMSSARGRRRRPAREHAQHARARRRTGGHPREMRERRSRDDRVRRPST